jgi:prepilin-type N-terminal cleavage/methylation domain-containing protein
MKKEFTKKAFTLAELSIVLVVLGIIIAMTLKGFGVLDAARLRNELGKINKFQTAYGLYFERTGKMLPKYIGGSDPGRLNIEPLYDYGLLEDDARYNKDFANYDSTVPDNETNRLFLSLCDRTPDIQTIPDEDNNTVISYWWDTSKTYEDDKGTADGICLVFNGYYPVFICGAETSYDDMKVHNSTGKYWGETGTFINAEETKWIGTAVIKKTYNCTNATRGVTNLAWAYMIF